MVNFLNHRAAKIWFKVSGSKNSSPVFYLHGGPGYASYSFQNSIGPELEKRLQMIYFDQRDCGYSKEVAADAPLTIEALVSDIEALRQHLGLNTINLLGHSFGGLLAIEYARKYPSAVDKMVLIDISGNLRAVIQHQIASILKIAARFFPDLFTTLEAIAGSSLSSIAKLKSMYDLCDELVLESQLYWFNDKGREQNALLDIQAGFPKGESRLVSELMASGYLESDHPELMQRLSHPAILFSGRYSQCVGERNIITAAEKWGIPLVWFEQSGHLPHIEEPQAFAQATFQFFGCLTGSL